MANPSPDDFRAPYLSIRGLVLYIQAAASRLPDERAARDVILCLDEIKRRAALSEEARKQSEPPLDQDPVQNLLLVDGWLSSQRP